jgi:hypothetical protein
LLEPQAEDGLVAWNFFDEWLGDGKEFVVRRVGKRVELAVRGVREVEEGK